MGSIDTQLADEFGRAFDEFTETITRRIRGSSASTEPVTAVVEMDTKAAIGTAGRAGLIETDEGAMIERGCLVEVVNSQTVHPQDKYVIQNEVWELLGKPIASDPGSKTLVCVIRNHLRGRQPRIRRE